MSKRKHIVIDTAMLARFVLMVLVAAFLSNAVLPTYVLDLQMEITENLENGKEKSEKEKEESKEDSEGDDLIHALLRARLSLAAERTFPLWQDLGSCIPFKDITTPPPEQA